MNRMMLTFTTAGAMTAVLSTTGVAGAQTKTELGDRGQFILGADRLMPLVSWNRISQDNFAGTATIASSQTGLSFFWGFSDQIEGQNGAPATLENPAAAQAQRLFFSVPRVGFDYVVIPHLTIGGNVAVYFTAGSTVSRTLNVNGDTVSGGNGGLFLFGVEPRVGYLLHLSDMWTLWLRGGLSFYTGTVHSGVAPDGSYSHFNADLFALDLEPQIVFTPVPHFGLTAAVNGDIGLVGRHSFTTYNGGGVATGEQSAPSNVLQFGLTLGMIGYF
jgi:hypothetical protein